MSVHLGREFFTYSVLFVIVSGCITIVRYFTRTLKIRSTGQYVWLIICTGILIYFTFKLRRYPEEAVHIPEYVLLAFLLFNALSYKIKDWTVYIDTVLLVIVLGTIDELIQWIIPNRVGIYEDVVINGLSGFIAVVGIRMGIRPPEITQPASRYSLTFLSIITAVAMIIIGLNLTVLMPG